MSDRSHAMSPTRRALVRLAAVLTVLWFGACPAKLSAQTPLITLNANDQDLADLLQALSVQHRLNLVAGDKVTGTVTISLFDVPLDDALDQILATQGLGYVKEGDFYRILTAEERDARILELDAVDTRVFTLSHLTNQEAQQLLRPLLSTDGAISLADAQVGGAAGGGGAGGGAAGGGAGTQSSGQRQLIVVRDRTSHLDVVARTLAEIDHAPRQVLLEATILSIDLGEDNRLGVDFNVLGGIDFDSTGAVSDLTGITGQSITNGPLNNSLFSGQTFGFTNDPPSEGLSLGFIKNNVAVFVEALEQTTNATIVSNPRVLAMNGHEAQIIVGGRLGYTTITTTETSSLEQVQFLDTGTQLVFRPFVGDDGWIRMNVRPRNSTGIVDPVSGIPSESTTEITTNILMRDGQTLVLGGLINEQVTSSRSEIPVLGSLPVIGWLFGRTQETINRSELVIMLTPHILDPAEAESRAEAARQRFEAVRRSHWESLSPYIRPVRARSLRADAEVHYAQGDLHEALGSVECALALDPTNAEAAVLRDRLIEEIALEQARDDQTDQAMAALQAMALRKVRTKENSK